MYLSKKFLVENIRDFGVTDGPVLLYGLYLALGREKLKHKMFVDV